MGMIIGPCAITYLPVSAALENTILRELDKEGEQHAEESLREESSSEEKGERLMEALTLKSSD